jgi:hypothetical protein
MHRRSDKAQEKGRDLLIAFHLFMVYTATLSAKRKRKAILVTGRGGL